VVALDLGDVLVHRQVPGWAVAQYHYGKASTWGVPKGTVRS
jgi:hypothetical protein